MTNIVKFISVSDLLSPRVPGGQFNQTPGAEQPGEFGPPGGNPNQDGYNFYPNSQQGPPAGQQQGQYSGPFPHPPYPNHTVNPGFNRVPTDTVSIFPHSVSASVSAIKIERPNKQIMLVLFGDADISSVMRYQLATYKHNR